MGNIQIRCSYDRLAPVSELKSKFNKLNANAHPPEQIDELVEQFKWQGVRHPAIVSKRTGLVVAGHGRILAAEDAGMLNYPISEQDFESEAQEYSFLIADNEVHRWSTVDLKKIHATLPNIEPFDISRLAIRDFQFEPNPPQGDADAVPDVPKVARTKRGELWTLGAHRLLIDDCTVKENVERLMAGEKADMVFTDPPYGIGYQYAGHDDSSSEDNAQLVAAALLAQECGKVWTPGLMNLRRELARFPKAKVAVWHKKFAAAGNGLGGASTWEPILIIDPTNRKLNNDVLVIQTEREQLNGQSLRDLHSCPKPVELYSNLMVSLSNEKEAIFEPFAGSGTTLMACEKTGRRCFGMEIEPLYGDVILSRWAKYTGKMPVREDGKTWDEVKNG